MRSEDRQDNNEFFLRGKGSIKKVRHYREELAAQEYEAEINDAIFGRELGGQQDQVEPPADDSI